MVWSIYVLAVLTQIVCLVSAQDYCTDRCKDAPPDVVCTCVLCPEHTCAAGEKECKQENTKCTTIGLGEEDILNLVCPISTDCVPENCDCRDCPPDGPCCPLVCNECEIGQEATEDCMVCCPGKEGPTGCKEPNECVSQEEIGFGDNGAPCPGFCAHECVEDDDNICCANDEDDNGCPTPPGPLIEVVKKNKECDKNFCPCKCEDPETGECCAAPVDLEGCPMEEDTCVLKIIEPLTGEPCPLVHCPFECDTPTEIQVEACDACEPDICCPKSKDLNGLFCPPDYDHGCGSCGCCDGLCCEGCVETTGEQPGCRPKGKCLPLDSIPKDISGNDCPKESVCGCCCKAGEKCCEQGIGPDGCKKPEKCEPKMEGCEAHCPCVDGLTCADGEKCCPGHKNEHGCEDPPVCTQCGTKTEGNCKGELCDCFCPASCELPLEIPCKAQIDCDGCHTPEVCLPRAKNVNGIFCDDDSASHGCPTICNEQAGETDCIPEPDVLGCKGKAVCVQRITDINGNFCPCATACQINQCPEGGLDNLGCPLDVLCGTVEVPAPVPVEEPEEPAVVVVEAPAEPPAEAPAEAPAE